MKPVAYLVKDAAPNYLSSLPIPDTIGGWFRLGFKDWLALIPPAAVLAGLTYVTYRAFCPHGRPIPSAVVNRNILKSNPKVVDFIDIEDISEKLCCVDAGGAKIGLIVMVPMLNTITMLETMLDRLLSRERSNLHYGNW
ncbi:hypothetical protein NQ317_005940 [Molorchus minor]|uniref:Iron sulphur domain-containing protein n=1 Tax=Molorchus minor TaxID=1323400 RepID=A0ABQ9J9X7_9CUCU|nr:hypothetical protein NQ317_005940 [Molorchus minor]